MDESPKCKDKPNQAKPGLIMIRTRTVLRSRSRHEIEGEVDPFRITNHKLQSAVSDLRRTHAPDPYLHSQASKQSFLHPSIHPSFVRSIHIPSLGILIYSVKMQFTLITAFATAFLASFVAANPAPAPAPFEIGIGANAAANAAAEVAANAGLGAGAGIHFKA
ncbi:hypothetical protein BO85DRAFT_442649 [Aspergillus piperis CBS 112811]|nr:hypothetical protein BO85DRAFT_442649 [Aspergillus piperis CBS 112811]RAH53095.1 hypothetical protein BO85DRAFT_442649 [Aspergillus piperis CBS 112811]